MRLCRGIALVVLLAGAAGAQEPAPRKILLIAGPPENDPELARLLMDAIGGRFEAGWSVNPGWRLQAALEPEHPAARAVGARCGTRSKRA